MRTLVISDMHFGSGDDLLRHPLALERIEPELEWAERLIVAGDMFELVFAPFARAVESARPFCELVERHIDELVYIPGNHDYQLVALAADRLRIARALGQADSAPFRVGPAEEIISTLCPSVRVSSAYPLCEIQGAVITHGHYLAQHVRGWWRGLDWLEWRLSGGKRRESNLTVADYEALIAPLYGLMYEIAQLPKGRRSALQNERLVALAGALVRAPGRAVSQVTGGARAALRVETVHEAERALGPGEPVAQIIAAITQVCENLEIPAGPVIFGHSHQPLEARASGCWSLYNSGSWVYDRYERRRPDYRQNSWPGTVLRLEDGRLSLRRLLEDLDERALGRMIGLEPRRHLRVPRRRRAQVVLPAET